MEQRKWCYSDPETLHQVEDTPIHKQCRSMSNQAEGLLSNDDPSTHGLVASRRKMFETKGRALSASSISKTTLKQIQHKVLEEYVELKTGHKMAEPQEANTPTLGQRHSMAWQPSDSAPRPLTGKTEARRKLTRPLSADHLLDDSYSSILCGQFTSTTSNEPARFSGWKETSQSVSGKSASTEGHFDQPEQLGSHISTPHSCQIEKNISEALPVSNVQMSSPQKKVESEIAGRKLQVLSGQEASHTRAKVPRGKSMEELAAPGVGEPLVLRKSLEHFDQLHSRRAMQDREERNVSLKTREQRSQGHAQRKPFFKQESAPQLRLRESAQGEDRSLKANSEGPDWAVPPVSPLSPPGRTHSRSSPSLTGPAESFLSSEFSLPLCPLIQGALHRESSRTKTAFPPSLSKGPSESWSRHSIKTSPPGQSLLLELSVDDPEDIQIPTFPQGVCLSHGVTADSDSWLITLEAGKNEEEGQLSPCGDTSLREGQYLVSKPQAASTAPVTERKAINTTQIEVSSEDEDEDEGVSVDEPEAPVSQAESEWKKLVEDVIAEDQSLAHVLFPVTNRTTTVMLMEQLLSEDTLLMEEHYRRKQAQSTGSSEWNKYRYEIVEREGKISSSHIDYPAPHAPAQQTSHAEDKGASDVTEKKRLLAACIRAHLQLLEEQQAALREEMQAIGEWAEAVDALVRENCPPAEHERYAHFVRDLERAVGLLLCLSARLARVLNALSSVDQHTDEEERESLDKRYHLLCKQRDDARELKDNLARRERLVSAALAKCLAPQQLQECRRFVQTKASLLIQQKDLEERRDLWEERLRSLLGSMTP
ncbi:protein Shroom1-like [Megalops cyprinoides]|uniref:protein Shroom1-like n=1 Tax=Megalops cyprinoides TaxID=118141 RepID=UPI00186543A6|nr:protein Shroom1-like [Megalops cyprinoides]